MTDLFFNINDRDKEKIFKLVEATTLIYKKGINILSNVRKENLLGIIKYGYIQVIRNDFYGNRILVDEVKTGGIFGSIILPVTDESYEIITKEETQIILIDFARITDGEITKSAFYNQFIKNLLKIITDVVLQRNERIELLTQKSIRDKLLEYFKVTAKKNGSRTFTLPFSFTELSEYLSVDRSAMSRELKNMKDEGFIKVIHKKITLLYEP